MYPGEFTSVRAETNEGRTANAPPASGDTSSSATWTFLFTDIAGSTRLWEGADGDTARAAAMRAALVRHETLLRDCIEARGGHFFKSVGDGVYAAFASPRAALDAAVAAQIALIAAFGGGEGDAPRAGEAPPPLVFGVRIALHTGEAEKTTTTTRA